MPNLLQSSQTQATTAPGYYGTYLTNLATNGATAAKNAQFVGAQPLQEQAFSQTDSAASAFQPTLTQAGNTFTSAGDMNSPLSSAQGYLNSATQSPAELAQSYMNPYIASAVQRMSDIGQRNIQQNLAPLATASAVGSGQFGSRRGAAVLGQTMSNAQNDINSQIAKQLTEGYGQALTAAGQRNQTMAQLGSTAGNLQSQGQQNLINLGKSESDLAAQNQELNLKKINALSTMGAQQQAIAQNRQLFPLQNMTTLAGLLRGYSVPTTTTTTAETSPLSALGAMGAGAIGLFTPGANGQTPWDLIKNAYTSATGSGGTVNTNPAGDYFTGGAGTGTFNGSNTSTSGGGGTTYYENDGTSSNDGGQNTNIYYENNGTAS